MPNTIPGLPETLAALLPADTTSLPTEISAPTCPKCGSDLELLRVYKGSETYRVKQITVDADNPHLPTGGSWAVVKIADDRDSDEYVEVLEEAVECRRYDMGCDYRLEAGEFAMDIV